MKRYAAIVLALFCLTSTTAWAHAVLLEATPSANSIVRDGHLHVLLRFNSRVDGKRSQLTLISLAGQTRVPLQDQTSPDKLSTADIAVKPGAYRLIWQVLAADGHLTRGQIPFHVQ